jgi:hypothetical protein
LFASESLHNGVNILNEPVANIPNPANQISRVCGGVQLANLDDIGTEADLIPRDLVPVPVPALTRASTGFRAPV